MAAPSLSIVVAKLRYRRGARLHLFIVLGSQHPCGHSLRGSAGPPLHDQAQALGHHL
jgi:hypothetical protein